MKHFCIFKVVWVNSLFLFLSFQSFANDISYEESIISLTVNYEESDILYTALKNDKILLIPMEALAPFNIKKIYLTPALVKIKDIEYVNLTLLKDVKYKLDEENLTLEINFPPNEIEPQFYNARSEFPANTINDGSISGMFWNYDITLSNTYKTTFTTALHDIIYFNPSGVFMHSLYMKRSLEKHLLIKGRNQKKIINDVVRLRTNWTFDDVENIARLRIGDSVTKAADWSGSTRFGGVQYATNFSIRPDLVTIPLVDFTDMAELPSTFDIYDKNISIFRGEAKKGEYHINDLPVTTGRGELILKAQDITGKIRTLTLPYYVSPILLKPDLANYSFDMGFQRRDFGLKSYHYKDFLINCDYLKGISNNWTPGVHFEYLKNKSSLGIINNFKIKNYGVISFSLANNFPNLKQSYKILFNYNFQGEEFSFNTAFGLNGNNYYDVYSHARPSTKKNYQISMGYNMEPFGSVFFNYFTYYSPTSKNKHHKTQTASGTYERKITKNGYIRFTSGKDLSNKKNGAFFLLSFGANFGVRSIGVNRSRQREGTSDEINIASYVNSPLGWGYKGRFKKNKDRDYDIQIDKRWQKVDTYLFVFRNNKVQTEQIEFIGSLVRMDGNFFFSKSISNSLALVKAGGIKDVPVYNNNRLVGYTDSKGKILVPDVLAYVESEIKLDQKKLPLDTYFADVTQRIAPKWKKGVIIDFGISKVTSVEMTLVDNYNKLIPFDERVEVENINDELFVGYNGKLFINNIGDQLTLRGKACSLNENKCCNFNAKVDNKSKEPIVDLGTVICNY